MITTGADGDIRIWNGVDDDDPNTQCVGEFILYHLYYQQRILTSTDLNTVQAYTYPDYNRDGTEFRFTAPVTCIKVNAKVKALEAESRCMAWLKISFVSVLHRLGAQCI